MRKGLEFAPQQMPGTQSQLGGLVGLVGGRCKIRWKNCLSWAWTQDCGPWAQDTTTTPHSHHTHKYRCTYTHTNTDAHTHTHTHTHKYRCMYTHKYRLTCNAGMFLLKRVLPGSPTPYCFTTSCVYSRQNSLLGPPLSKAFLHKLDLNKRNINI